MELTANHLDQLLPRLCARDVYELQGIVRGSLEDWAKSRLAGPGVAWALLARGEVWIAGGVLEGAVRGIGALWFVKREGWEPYVKHLLRVWRVILSDGGFRRLEAKVYADNERANFLAARVGFKPEGTLRAYTVRGEDINQYGMVIGG